MACSVVVHKEAMERFHETAVGVGQGYPLTPILSDNLLKKMVAEPRRFFYEE